MRRLFLTLLAITITLACAQAEESNLCLELESPTTSLRLGESQKLKLKVSGSDIYDIIKMSEGIDTSNIRTAAFVYEFEFKPQREGSFTFGPYTIEMNGKKLTSNKVGINVCPPWDGSFGTFFRVNKDSISLGESVELIMETWSKNHARISVILDRNESFSSTMGPMNSSAKMSNGSMTTYLTRSWVITPKESGEFKIAKELFREFSEGIQPPNFTIKVEEKK